MGILNLLGLGQVAAPIEAVGSVLNELFTSDAEKLTAQELLERLKQNPQQWTFELNKLNAGDIRLFNSGWRPFVGWVCGICVALYYIPQFVLADYLWFTMCLAKKTIVDFPINPDSLMQLLWLMLGFGAYRTVEKVKGVSRE